MFPVCLQGQYWWTSPHVDFRVRMGSGSYVWDMANCERLSGFSGLWCNWLCVAHNHSRENWLATMLFRCPPSSHLEYYTDKHIIERQAKSQQIAEQSLLS